MSDQILSEEEKAEWWLFLKANPIGVDPNILNPEELAQLPENVKKTLWDEKTSALIYLLGNQNGLKEDKISEIARIIRQIALGETSAGQLTETLKNKLGVSENIAQAISSKLAKEIIAPNYFQISQLYDKKHVSGPQKTAQKTLTGRPLETLAKNKPEENNTTVSKTNPSKNVIDLRKTGSHGILPPPLKLPPAPPQVPIDKNLSPK